ncbi:MAG: hypothetical protein HQM11_08890 [SAR324 cluster bacterium]|nr:hypothetical protein [SAR324 cluster bacterium]
MKTTNKIENEIQEVMEVFVQKTMAQQRLNSPRVPITEQELKDFQKNPDSYSHDLEFHQRLLNDPVAREALGAYDEFDELESHTMFNGTELPGILLSVASPDDYTGRQSFSKAAATSHIQHLDTRQTTLSFLENSDLAGGFIILKDGKLKAEFYPKTDFLELLTYFQFPDKSISLYPCHRFDSYWTMETSLREWDSLENVKVSYEIIKN